MTDTTRIIHAAAESMRQQEKLARERSDSEHDAPSDADIAWDIALSRSELHGEEVTDAYDEDEE